LISIACRNGILM